MPESLSSPLTFRASPSAEAYERIENYGLIGNMRTVALVSMKGSIDWFCFPAFDSPSVFGAILDCERGGRFSISPRGTGDVVFKQLYWPDTNVLITRFQSPDGVAEIEDFMPVGTAEVRPWANEIVRRVRAVRGRMILDVLCEPAFDYARIPHTVELEPDGAMFRAQSYDFGLSAPIQLARTPRGVRGELALDEGQRATFVFRQIDRGASCGMAPRDPHTDVLFERTIAYWRRWLSQCTYRGRWREAVHRSALVLKLLTFEPTGAIIAAPTCSLPEAIGGTRNWDYRYVWMRDAAFTVYGLLRIGFTHEAARFMEYLEARCREATGAGSLQIVYGIDGRRDLSEHALDHLAGYQNSRPVRIGNGACHQLQLDVYGELMDSVYLFNKYGAPISYDLWTYLRRLVDYVASSWNQRDEGVWEVRSDRQHFVFSKLMCWVALDRGLRLAEKRSFPADRQRWLNCRDEIFETIMTRGWNEELRAFTQTLDGADLDASNLIMPLVFFVSPTDPKMLHTLDAIMQPPSKGGLTSDGLVYRYRVGTPDGLPPGEGTFNMCSFWLVEALTRSGRANPRNLEVARLLFERILGYSNHLGLYSEEIGDAGEALGNYPQGFTHLALISAAYNLDRLLSAA